MSLVSYLVRLVLSTVQERKGRKKGNLLFYCFLLLAVIYCHQIAVNHTKLDSSPRPHKCELVLSPWPFRAPQVVPLVEKANLKGLLGLQSAIGEHLPLARAANLAFEGSHRALHLKPDYSKVSSPGTEALHSASPWSKLDFPVHAWLPAICPELARCRHPLTSHSGRLRTPVSQRVRAGGPAEGEIPSVCARGALPQLRKRAGSLRENSRGMHETTVRSCRGRTERSSGSPTRGFGSGGEGQQN